MLASTNRRWASSVDLLDCRANVVIGHWSLVIGHSVIPRLATLTRYVVWELLKILVIWLGLFTGLLLFVFLGLEATRSGVSPAIVVQLVPFLLPQTLAYAIPATTLLAVCIVYGRVSAANEVVAIKSLGIKPIALAWPAFALSFVLSLVCVWLNDIAFSWGETGMRRVVIQSAEEIVYGMLRTNRVYSSKRLSILVRDVEGRRLVRPVITINGEDGSDLSVTITADEAELRSNLEHNTLKLVLVNGVFEGGGSLQGAYPGRYEHEVPLTLASSRGDLELGPTHISLRDMQDAIVEQRQKIRRQRERLAAEVGFHLISGDMLELNEPNWNVQRQELKSFETRLYRLQSEFPRRTASGFMCLFFTLIGVPIAIRLKQADTSTVFMLCFVPILLGYMVIFALCLNRAKEGAFNPWTLWTANILCGLIAHRLWKAIDRY
jgi:lipopolysaccharide export system permease protein